MKNFKLLESILWRPGRGFYLLQRHLMRLRNSARYFGFNCPGGTELRRTLDAAVEAVHPVAAVKIRVLVDALGHCKVTIEHLQTLTIAGRLPWKVAIADEPVNQDDPFLRHKTTRRTVYDRARSKFPACDDVLLWNCRGQATETTVANVLFDFGDGQWLTPAAGCGLLPGVFRGLLLDQSLISEAVIALDEVRRRRPEVMLINSVRRRIPASLARP